MIRNKYAEQDRRENFFDLPPTDRAAIRERAAERGGACDFYDLPPEDRARAYDWDSDER